MNTCEELQTAVKNGKRYELRGVLVQPRPGPHPEFQIEVIEVSQREWLAVTEQGKHKPICFVSAHYTLIQNEDVFMPILNENPNCVGFIESKEGASQMHVFPQGQDYEMDADTRIGIVIRNSVDKTSAVIIKVGILHDGRLIILPRDVSTYYKAHMGKKMQEQTSNYIELLNKVKGAWGEILKELSGIEITTENFDVYTKDFKVNPRFIKELKLKLEAGNKYNLWSLTMALYDKIDASTAKTEIHRRDRLESFTNSIMKWSTLLRFVR